jgi:putative lipoic acid-binding regulatory protein
MTKEIRLEDRLPVNQTTGEETYLEFPCLFPIKVMGRCEEDFDVCVVEIIRKHVEDIHEGSVVSRPSAKGNFQSVTVTITAHSKAQLDKIYMELSAHERVVMCI